MVSGLTSKQREVCDLLVRGFSSKAIGARLGISHRTVDDHREEIYRKMGVRNVVELVRKMLVKEDQE